MSAPFAAASHSGGIVALRSVGQELVFDGKTISYISMGDELWPTHTIHLFIAHCNEQYVSI